MYAVVKTGGKQHKVIVGETVSVELLDAEAGSVVTLPVLLVNDGEKLITGEDAAAATVTAEVLGHGKADKVMVFKFKKRKGYKRTRGHRQNLTLIKVTDIALAGAKKAAKAPKAKAAEAATAEVVVEKKPAAKKAAAAAAARSRQPRSRPPRRPAAARRRPAEKPAAKKAAAERPQPRSRPPRSRP